MDMSIILPAALLAAAVIYITMRMAIGRKRLRRPADNAPAPDMDEIFVSAIQPCGAIIDSALKCLADGDSIGACRAHRTGSDTLAVIGAKTRREYPDDGRNSDKIAVYMNYMLDAAEKIAATSRLIATLPDNSLSLADRCEIESVRHHIDTMVSEATAHDGTADGTCKAAVTAADNKTFIEHLIDLHSKSMSHDDFNDGSMKYSLLTLLYYLHSFINSFQYIAGKLPACLPGSPANKTVMESIS